MRQCKRGTGNLIVTWFSMIFLLAIGIVMIVYSFLAQGRIPGSPLFQVNDMWSLTANKISLLLMGSLFFGLGVYLAVQLFRTKGVKIEYNEACIVFHMGHQEKRSFLWSLLREPAVRITWVTGKQLLIFAFADGKQLKVPSKYNGFQQLYAALARSGVPVTIKKTRQEERQPKSEAALKQRQKFLKGFTILFAAATVLCFSLVMIEKYSPKGDPVPFDPDDPEETYAYLDIYSATRLAKTTGGSAPKEYFYYTYNSSGKPCIFSMDAWYTGLETPDLGGEPIFRLQGYTSKHHSMLEAMLMQDMGLSQDEFREMFGNRYLTAGQDSRLYHRYMVMTAFFLLFALFGLSSLRWVARKSRTGCP